MTDAIDWYAMADLPPGQIARVVVMWSGRSFVAARMARRGVLSWCLADEDARRVVWLPPADECMAFAIKARDGMPWSSAPDCWRPADSAWRWPNGVVPPPLPPHMVPRLWVSAQCFGEIMNAEMAMTKQEHNNRGATRGQRRKLWWLDPTEIGGYAPAGNVTRRDCEGRLMRAVASDSFDVKNGVALRAAWGEDTLSRLAEVEQRCPSDDVPRFKPLQVDLADYSVAMSWFAALERPHRAVVALASRMQALSFGDMAYALGGKLRGSAAAARYHAAIDEAHLIANGGENRRVVHLRDVMDDIRHRTRLGRMVTV